MIERILPPSAVAVEAWRDEPDIELFPEEELVLGNAVDKRRREFTTARACARAALAKLGHEPVSIPAGERGEPCWPAGVVGSITHCNRYRACALARDRDLLALGIDAEPDAHLPAGLLPTIACKAEIAHLDDMRQLRPDVRWDRLLFSAKESVYKALFPLTRRSLSFEDAVLAFDPPAGAFDAGVRASRAGAFDARGGAFDPCAGAFDARLLVPGPALGDGRVLRTLSGRWMACDGVVLTAIAISTRSAI